jgi:hypothetical protein
MHREFRAPILLTTLLIFHRAYLDLLSVADDLQPVWFHPSRNQCLPGSFCSLLT